MITLFRRLALSFLFGILLINSAFCQNPNRFQNEIDRFKADTTDYTAINDLVLFTGSSSIRFWTDVQKDFPDLHVINTGFGGSHMSDLLYYADTVILHYRPVLIFIYEGDNDLADGKKPGEILMDAGKLIRLIRQNLPRSTICFILPKPSILRWNLKDTYLDFNHKLKGFTVQFPNVCCIDVWDRMIGADGNPRRDIFLEDGLHMNRKGYALWKDLVGKFLKSHRFRGKA